MTEDAVQGKPTAFDTTKTVAPEAALAELPMGSTGSPAAGVREVQERVKSGETYDQVELIASDERRDVAALRIPAGGLPVLPIGNCANAASGATVFVVSNAVGLPWTASSGILSATRTADDVPGAGSGYRILQFTAPLAPGSSGSVLVDAEARILAIVVGSFSISHKIKLA